MNNKIEGISAISAALLVLFSAMWDARISAGVAILALGALGFYHLLQKPR
jgi:hypothetical protein